MALEIGSRLGHYDVTALIGEGGMGQVYQATDTKLNRQVALKILPEAFASDPDRLARFQREAQVLASLNHPGIASIYGLEDSEGTKALVLELVEGPTLADRIAQGPIPIDEVLPIAKQIAEALEAAHEAGVIHRDLKPANIKLRPDGAVKVLDFGLAKALDTTPEGDPSLSPTLTAAATQMGVIMGTAAYMSPEQARGKPVDKRADIWAFGVVLYEMLTGTRPFQGEDVSLTLASVMKSDVNVTVLPADLPETLRTVIRHCLQKDPKRRIRDVGDVQLAMEGVFEAKASAPPFEGTTSQPAGWRRSLSVGLIGVVVGGVVTGLTVWNTRVPEPGSVTRFLVMDGPSASSQIPMALSPDGQTLVYVTRQGEVNQLYQRLIDALEAVPISGTEGASMPFFSPDSQSVGFFADGALKKVSLTGGTPLTLCPADGTPGGATWGADGTIVFQLYFQGLSRVSEAGGVPELITSPEGEEGVAGHSTPTFLPGDQAVLFVAYGSERNSWVELLVLETGEQRRLLDGFNAQYVSTGHMVFGREDGLWAVPFDLDSLDVTGQPFPVLQDVAVSGLGFSAFALTRDGSLVYIATEGATASLVWVDRNGQETALAAPPAPYLYPRISPDGTRVTIFRGDQTHDVWILELSGETLTPLTSDPGQDLYGEWTPPDGQRVVFSSLRGASASLFWRASDFTGDADRLTEAGELYQQYPQDIAPDGSVLVFRQTRTGTDSDLRTVSLMGDPIVEDLLSSEFEDYNAAISPDGRWFAYQSDLSGEFEVYVRSFPDAEAAGLHQISTRGGQQPLWGPDGKELFYVNDNRLWSVEITMEPTFSRGEPTMAIDGGYLLESQTGHMYDVDPITGDRFLMIKPLGGVDGPTSPLTVVLNWAEELKRLAPD
jgi:serine/threonine-protein kinase